MALKRSIFTRVRPAIVLSAVAANAFVSPAPVLAQSVADRTLSDVNVDNVGNCSTLTVNFNIRVQMLSYFPTQAGRELHIRISPLDRANGLRRESLRTPSSVPALRSIEYEGDNPAGPILSLFFTHDMRFEVEPGTQPQSLIIRIAEPGAGPICGAAQAPVGVAPPPGVEIPEGLYVINLMSTPKAPGELAPGQKALLSGRVLYESLFERDSQQWHRLRAGFFVSREQAEAARQKLAAEFPEAFVVKVSAQERAQGVLNRIDAGIPSATRTPTESTATEAEVAETAKLIAEAETAISEGNNDRAIQLLTNALALPENENTPRALELLGLTRERKGQAVHAQAEYEEYLRRYPSGEASDRVRQRLAAITMGAAGAAGAPELRRPAETGRSATAWHWGARGSVSQFYFRDQSKTKFIDASRPELDPEVDESVNLNQLLSSADVTISGGNDIRQFELRAAGAYSANFRTGGKDIKSLTSLYLDYSDNAVDMAARLGRQTRNSSGVLGRFDGLLLGWQAKPKIRLNLVGGFPVLTSRQTHILKERYFYGASVDIGARRSPFQTTLYWFDQRAKGGFIDRQSVGIEARYLKSRFNAYTIIDYDVKYKKLNLGLLTLNYVFPDNANLSLTADYRQSPLLTTSNALIGQIYSGSFLPVLDLRELEPFFTDSEIYQLAEDRTLVVKSLTLSYSRPLSKKLQANLDFTLTDTGGTPATPASAGTEAVFALPSAGTEFYYGAQLVGTGLLWENDIYILSGRFADTQTSNVYTADFNARVPITSKFRMSPRLRYGLRNSKVMDSKFRQFQPTARFNYYPTRDTEIEVEVGANFSRDSTVFAGALTKTNETGWVLSTGYRIDF